MNLPPRLPAPSFTPDPADVPRIVTAARRRRARQSGGAAAALASLFVVLIVTSGGGQAGLSQREVDRPVAPPPAASPTVPAPGAVARQARPADGQPGTAPPPAVPRSHPPTVTAAPPAAVRPTARLTPDSLPVPEGPDLRLRSDVVADRPGVPCQWTAQARDANAAAGVVVRDYCVRWWWAPETKAGSGVTFYQEYCATQDDAAPMEHMSPSLRVTGSYYGWDSDHVRSRATEATLRTAQCLRWSLRWDGSGRRLGDGRTARRYLPAGTYGVGVSVGTPRLVGGGPAFTSGGMQEGAPGQTTLRIV